MSPFWIVLNVISALILIAYIAYGICRKKRIKKAQKASVIEKNKTR